MDLPRQEARATVRSNDSEIPMRWGAKNLKQQHEESKAIRDAETAAERKAFNEAMEEAKAAFISETQEIYGE